MSDLESWEYGNPEHVAMRRQSKERLKNTALKQAFEKAKARVEADKLFKEPHGTERITSITDGTSSTIPPGTGRNSEHHSGGYSARIRHGEERPSKALRKG